MDRKEEKLKKKNNGFKCCHCKQRVPFSNLIGTEHRNHCPFCLWSKHVDLNKPGDRKSECGGDMKPVGLTFKQEGIDKWGKLKQGELMLIHLCRNCGKISINRVAADDNPRAILKIWKNSKSPASNLVGQLAKNGIKILGEKEKKEILSQLFGKNSTEMRSSAETNAPV